MPSRPTTQLLRSVTEGAAEAEPALLDAVYGELRSIAAGMVGGRRGVTMQPTELIHEAWLRLIDPEADAERWEGKRHFRRVAARAMRYVLVDRARARGAAKRGGSAKAVTLDEQLVEQGGDADTTLAVHDGLERLAELDPDLARLVELRFFGGCTMDEVADNLGISVRSAHRSWRLAKAWWVEQFGAQS